MNQQLFEYLVKSRDTLMEELKQMTDRIYQKQEELCELNAKIEAMRHNEWPEDSIYNVKPGQVIARENTTSVSAEGIKGFYQIILVKTSIIRQTYLEVSGPTYTIASNDISNPAKVELEAESITSGSFSDNASMIIPFNLPDDMRHKISIISKDKMLEIIDKVRQANEKLLMADD